MPTQFAYLTQGKLHRRSAETGEDTPIESAFGRSLRDRAAQIHNRHAWKMKGSGAQFMYGMLGPAHQHDPGELRVAITSVCPGREPGSVFYSLETSEVGGIFAVDPAGVEDRLFHTADFRVRHLASSANRDEVAAAIVHGNGCANIAVMRADGSGLTEVTEGESMDVAPSWVAGAGPRRLVFQSAGLGRDAAGRFSRLGPAAIQSLNLDSGELSTVAEEPQADLLCPRMLADGTLFYIRRPYVTSEVKVSALGVVRDTILLPFRLVFAVFQFFNFFAMRYTGSPLTGAPGVGGAPREGEGPQAPASWQLMRRASDAAAAEPLAKGVLSFDVGPDGEVIYSNGSAIYRLDAASRRSERVLKCSFIEHVAALP